MIVFFLLLLNTAFFIREWLLAKCIVFEPADSLRLHGNGYQFKTMAYKSHEMYVWARWCQQMDMSRRTLCFKLQPYFGAIFQQYNSLSLTVIFLNFKRIQRNIRSKMQYGSNENEFQISASEQFTYFCANHNYISISLDKRKLFQECVFIAWLRAVFTLRCQ